MRTLSTRYLAGIFGAVALAAASQASFATFTHHQPKDDDCEPTGCIKDYKFGDYCDITVTGNSSDPGLVIHTDIYNSIFGKEFSLKDGECKTFKLFAIWTNESDVGNDDTVKKDITVNLGFELPDTTAVISGDTFGVKGVFQYGKVKWDGPVIIDIPGDRKFKVSLSDEIFNKGFFGLNEGECYGANVDVKVCQISSECDDGGNIPEPASLSLLGLGAAGLLLRRRTK